PFKSDAQLSDEYEEYKAENHINKSNDAKEVNEIKEVREVSNVKVTEDEDPFSNASDASWDNDIKNEEIENKTDIAAEENIEEIDDKNGKEDNYEFDINEDDQYMFGDDDEEEFFFDNESK
ncbi:hypothetical protein H263_02519, partial [Brachyspira hampsonii 30599]